MAKHSWIKAGVLWGALAALNVANASVVSVSINSTVGFVLPFPDSPDLGLREEDSLRISFSYDTASSFEPDFDQNWWGLYYKFNDFSLVMGDNVYSSNFGDLNGPRNYVNIAERSGRHFFIVYFSALMNSGNSSDFSEASSGEGGVAYVTSELSFVTPSMPPEYEIGGESYVNSMVRNGGPGWWWLMFASHMVFPGERDISVSATESPARPQGTESPAQPQGNPLAVPEPGSLGLLGAGLAVWPVARRFGQRKGRAKGYRAGLHRNLAPNGEAAA